ncbi:uncharacterized protein TNCV_1723181 [Trichonephila clavipes]|nr:uncharacterized protein TNCV_1723181 [Trichonephila clavipes]
MCERSLFTLCPKKWRRIEDNPDRETFLRSVAISHSTGSRQGFVKFILVEFTLCCSGIYAAVVKEFIPIGNDFRTRFQECDEEDVETWMACDAEDCGFQMLNDDEIVTSVQEESDPVDDKMDEDEDNRTTKVARVHQMLTRFLR